MESRYQIMQDFLKKAKSELLQNGEMGYTMPDGNYHIYSYVDQEAGLRGLGERFLVMEPNKVMDGAHEPIGDNYLSNSLDLSEALIGFQWCMEVFEADRQKEASVVKSATVQKEALPDELIVRMAHEAGWMEAAGKIEVHDWDELRTGIRDAIQKYYDNPSQTNPFNIETVLEQVLLERFAPERSEDYDFEGLEYLPKDTLVDLLKAYDSYIITAGDAQLFDTGWTPVCLREFYESEYQNVWDAEKGAESFEYMFKDEVPEVSQAPEKGRQDQSALKEFRIPGIPCAIFRDEPGNLLIQHPMNLKLYPLKSNIQDIEAGDCFISGLNLYIAEEDAHQNLDEPDEPWIVYACEDEWLSFFAEDILNVERKIVAMEHGKDSKQISEGLAVNLVSLIRERPSENDLWTNTFWVDAKQVPSADLFRAAVASFLATEDGHVSIERSSEDFNWGDAIMDMPETSWNRYGIYPVNPMLTPKEMGLMPTPNCNPISLVVDQDEVLIPESYWEQKQESKKLSLDMQIQNAGGKANNGNLEHLQHQKDTLEK